MAVWDLNSNLDVFGMQTFLRGLIYDTGSPEPLVFILLQNFNWHIMVLICYRYFLAKRF